MGLLAMVERWAVSPEERPLVMTPLRRSIATASNRFRLLFLDESVMPAARYCVIIAAVSDIVPSSSGGAGPGFGR